MPFNLPILLTWLRIVAIPLLIAVYYLPADWATSRARLGGYVLFCAAALTDWADGYLGTKAEPDFRLWRLPRSGCR
jgi:CDP-diacylglycerol--glycerol-3-phosphate 3-phosphatidyltransferase/cardiolipin synthase